MTGSIKAGRFEAALNCLMEERRAVQAARSGILRDQEMAARHPGERHQLLAQTQREIGQLTDAIALLQAAARVNGGPVKAKASVPIGAWG